MSKQFYDYLIRLNEYDRRIKLSDTLAWSLMEFKSHWEKFASEFQFAYKNLIIDFNNHVVTIKLEGNENIAIVANLIDFNDEKILKSITMFASGDGTTRSGADMLIAIGIIIACLNPHENVEFRKKIFKELGINDIKIGTNNALIVNDFKYAISLTQKTGLMFSVSRV